MKKTALAFVLLALSACDSAPPDVTDISLQRNPNPAVPLAAIFSVATDEPATLELSIDDGERQWSLSPGAEAATSHEFPILGMRADREHTITATLTDAKGNAWISGPLKFATEPLPDLFPTPMVTVREVDAMEPGVTLFNLNFRNAPDTPANWGPAVIVNDEGEFIWYYSPEGHKVHDIRRMPNGNFIYEIWPGTGGMVEIDMLGNILRRWHFTGTAKDPAEGSIPVETDSFHHDFIDLPNGNLLLLSSENRVIDDWYTSETEAMAPRAPANVVGDVIVEMTMEGEVLREWKFHDILDPYRIGYRSLRQDFWARHYDGVVEGPVHDWSHGNAIIYDESDNSFIMSVPYQDAVIKISMDSGELVWILGNPDNWREPWSDKLLTPVGDVEWSYKHHAVSHTENGTYLLFDNGVARSSPFNEGMPLDDSYSRAVEYEVDEENMEVRQVWTYGPEDENFFARFLGDVDWQPQTDNVLITVGAQEQNADGVNAPFGPGTQRWARLMEVTHDENPEKVWEMQLKEDGVGWAIYRAERLPSLYP
jgi:hypothetical protein